MIELKTLDHVAPPTKSELGRWWRGVDRWSLIAALILVLIGLVIVGMLLWRPQGLFPERLVVSQTGRVPAEKTGS